MRGAAARRGRRLAWSLERDSMEPSRETYQLVGQLCVGWSYLEMLTERILWGILGLNERQAKAFLWKMDILRRWNMIVREAPATVPSPDVEVLKKIRKAVDDVARDRNIVVHGTVHAMLAIDEVPPKGTAIGTIDEHPPFQRIPCWTIYMGEDAGKSFPVSAAAVETIISNVEVLQQQAQAFIKKHNYHQGTSLNEHVEEGWPKRLQEFS